MPGPITKSATTAAAVGAAARWPAGTAQVTGAQLAMAFDGKLERVRTSPGYHLGVLLVALAMVLLPVAYFAIIAGTVWAVLWHARHSAVMFKYVRGRAIILVAAVYVAPILAGALLVVSMLLPLFWRSCKTQRPIHVDRREQPLLYAYVDQLCDAMRAPRPVRIDVTADTNASAHVDNGAMGLIYRRLVLTIGLPLASSMDLRQFTGVLAHELGHFAQGGSMRVTYLITRINGWFVRMAYGRSGVDDLLESMASGGDTHWAFSLIVLFCHLVLLVARAILRLLALVSHGLSMHLSRQAEYDADRQAARVVGSQAMGAALEALPALTVAGSVALDRARQGWQRRRHLPDDLVLLTGHYSRHLPQAAKDSIDAQILSEESSWFDTHPPLFRRVALLRRAGLKGVLKLDAPATFLFRDFDELSKLATLDFYSGVLGPELQPEHVYPTVLPQSGAAAAAAAGAK